MTDVDEIIKAIQQGTSFGKQQPIKNERELLPDPPVEDKENYIHFFAKMKLYDWLRTAKHEIIKGISITDHEVIYLEFPLVYPYWGFIHDTFIRDEMEVGSYSIYPKIDARYFRNEGNLDYNQVLELLNVLRSYWSYGEPEFLEDPNKIAEITIWLLKEAGINKESTQHLFTDFANEFTNDGIITLENVGKLVGEPDKLLASAQELINQIYGSQKRTSWYPMLKYVEDKIRAIINKRIIYYLDIGIVHEGSLIAAIEIVNKSPVNIRKAEYIIGHVEGDFPLVIIPANIILQHYEIPDQLYGYIYYKDGWFLRRKKADVSIDITSKRYHDFIEFDNEKEESP